MRTFAALCVHKTATTGIFPPVINPVGSDSSDSDTDPTRGITRPVNNSVPACQPDVSCQLMPAIGVSYDMDDNNDNAAAAAAAAAAAKKEQL